MGALTDAIKEQYKNIRKLQVEYQKELVEKIQKASDESDERMYHSFGIRQAECIKRIFDKVIDDFYATSAVEHSGRNSLYNIVRVENFQYDDIGTVDYEPIDKLYDKNAVTGRGGADVGLFNLVYMEGWHGGAPSGPGHPHPGTPYYRRPRGEWYRWGRRAVISYPSPHAKFQEELTSAEDGEILDIFKEEVDAEWEVFTKEVPNIISEIQTKYFKGML